MPAEWAPHEAVWIGFPSHVNAWEAEPLAPAQMQMAAFANAVHDAGKGELVRLIAGTPEAVNHDAYGAWLYRIKPAGVVDLGKLLDAAGYEATIGET